MTGFKARNWLAVAILMMAVVGFAYDRYLCAAASVPPQTFAAMAEDDSVRVLGRVQAGSVKLEGETLSFALEEGGTSIQVAYRGPDKDMVRELKALLVFGKRLPDGSMAAGGVSSAANYSFIAAAYGLALGLLLLFAWMQERAVRIMEKRLEQP